MYMLTRLEWNNGNYQGAHNASHMGKKWGIAGIITGVIMHHCCLFCSFLIVYSH